MVTCITCVSSTTPQVDGRKPTHVPPVLLLTPYTCTAPCPLTPPPRWPKTSLGCLKDGVRLTPEQLDTLTRICRWEWGDVGKSSLLLDAFPGSSLCASSSQAGQ